MIRPNTVLQSRYLVLEQIGQGGMGAVYKATDQRFGSTVALKETFFDDPGLRRAFEREAHLLNRLRHPALPRVSDHFVEDEGQFLVMEYIAGHDLSEMLEQRGGAAFPLEQVLAWADQLLDALDYLHTHEPPVIHRDIKPQNLKLAGRNQIVLLDFGLAKGTPVAITRATAAGSVFGYSRNYAPLEQMQGTGTDTRSDLYSLAATLYHLMTGAVPPDALTRAMATVDGQPDPLRPADAAHTQVTPSVASVISKAMAQSAAARYQTAEEMREALRAAARRLPEERAAGATLVAADARAGLQDQATQLMGAETSARPAGATHADAPAQTSHHARGTDLPNVHEAATLLGPSAGTAARGAQAPRTPAGGGEDASVVTRVRPAHSAVPAAPARGPRLGLLLGGAFGLVALLLVGGALYFNNRNAGVSTQSPAPAEQPAPSAAGATPEPQPSAQTPADVQAPATASATPETPQAPARASAAATPRSARRPAEETEPDEEPDEEPEVHLDAATQAEVERALREAGIPHQPGAHPPGLTPEQQQRLRLLPRRIRRMLLDQQRMNLQRERELERERLRRERERRRQQPIPAPAPAPPPR